MKKFLSSTEGADRNYKPIVRHFLEKRSDIDRWCRTNHPGLTVPKAHVLFEHLPEFDTLQAPFEFKDRVIEWFERDSERNFREFLVSYCKYIGCSDLKELDKLIDGNRPTKEEAEKIESFLLLGSVKMICEKDPLPPFYDRLLGKMKRI